MSHFVFFVITQNQAPISSNPSSPIPNPLSLFPISETNTHFGHLSIALSLFVMKRTLTGGELPVTGDDDTSKMKRIKQDHYGDEEEGVNRETGSGFVHLDENLLFEVLKHVDARTLGRAACVNRQWHRTALDERLWELICTKHSPNIGCGNQQLRSVVLALGGFRRLHSLYLWPLSKPQSASTPPLSAPSTSSSWGPLAPMIGAKPSTRWGKDEVHLSLSLLSIRYYEKMNFGNRNR